MPLYFSDFEDGRTKHVDRTGTELGDVAMVPGEAVELLKSVLRDISPGADDRTFIVNVRNDIGRIIFRASLVLKTEWIEAAGKN
jgi:hypothetical protein